MTKEVVVEANKTQMTGAFQSFHCKYIQHTLRVYDILDSGNKAVETNHCPYGPYTLVVKTELKKKRKNKTKHVQYDEQKVRTKRKIMQQEEQEISEGSQGK